MKKLFYFLIPITLFSCSGETENVSADGFQLPDSLFAYRDLESTVILDSMNWVEDGGMKIYTDSKANKAFIKLDSVQKMRLLAPVIGIDSNYIVQYMDALFVSKQSPINGLTPVMIYLYGDDYSALHYLLLDASLKPVSNFIVYGGEVAGPIDETDSTITLSPIINSFFKGEMFYHYSRTETMSLDSMPRPSIFDSIYYEHKIDAMGKITSKRLDSVRFERMPKEQEYD